MSLLPHSARRRTAPPRRTHACGKNAAFTLIELLVVIAIIAILAAILFPVFAQAREKARQTACLSNTKQIGLAIMQYFQDYDEKLPSVNNQYDKNDAYAASNPVTNAKWIDTIYPYVKSTQVFNCPSDSFAGGAIGNLPYVPIKNGRTTNAFGSYGFSQAYYGGTLVHGPSGTNYAAFAAPSNTVLIAEVKATGSSGDFYCVSEDNQFSIATGVTPRVLNDTYSGGPQPLGPTERHQGFGNILMADGHSKAMNLDQLTAKHTVGTKQVEYWFSVEDD